VLRHLHRVAIAVCVRGCWCLTAYSSCGQTWGLFPKLRGEMTQTECLGHVYAPEIVVLGKRRGWLMRKAVLKAGQRLAVSAVQA
jgi:hypothetical protein